jgi:hypothetical protein
MPCLIETEGVEQKRGLRANRREFAVIRGLFGRGPGAQEPDAYRLQAAWLAERGQEIEVNRIAVVLAAGCTPKDIHPD